MPEEICECGHPRRRHAWGIEHCTFNERKDVGIGYNSCHCPEFKLKKEPQPRVTGPLVREFVESRFGITKDGDLSG